MKQREMWGIVGGLGPLASAEFVKSIYECWPPGLEQEAPRVILHSDPSTPDRTRSFSERRDTLLARRLIRVIKGLLELGASRIVICCVTMHHVLHRCPPPMRARVVSLIDVIAVELAQACERHLMLCSQGARDCRVFERCTRWPEIQSKVVFPDAADQAFVHEVIYRDVKRGRGPAEAWSRLRPLLRKYSARGFVAGCTDLHLVTRHLRQLTGEEHHCIDPLATLARRLAGHTPLAAPIHLSTAVSAARATAIPTEIAAITLSSSL